MILNLWGCEEHSDGLPIHYQIICIMWVYVEMKG
jgi:hypothetical protein